MQEEEPVMKRQKLIGSESCNIKMYGQQDNLRNMNLILQAANDQKFNIKLPI